MGGFEAFFSDNYDGVVRTLALATGDRQRAEDAAQVAFARAYRKWPTVEVMDRPAGWVVVVGVREMRRWITRHDRRFGEPAAPDDRQVRGRPPQVADPADSILTADSIRRALDSLPPRQRATGLPLAPGDTTSDG